MADQLQLLDLVGTLIEDHRHSLLEQQRLREQLAAMQHKLHAERLDKDRVAALADVRSEEACKAQADLALASAAVKQLHAKCAISSTRIQLPPANPAAAAQGGVRASVSVLSDAAEPVCSSAAQQGGSGSSDGHDCGWLPHAAAASSFMTMRPAHMYKSVSTVYAMYSPLRGDGRAAAAAAACLRMSRRWRGSGAGGRQVHSSCAAQQQGFQSRAAARVVVHVVLPAVNPSRHAWARDCYLMAEQGLVCMCRDAATGDSIVYQPLTHC
ncbi:hypothetical protein COO60DRAFT_1626154 [Scenedesmus sp. NREL 46B-D3]|nr:hypothetical protein COO60DRAFT_1626154 [Scenedesmus sp. NREL 46B-D3]